MKNLFLALLVSAVLSADIEDHFKRIDHGPASAEQSMRNIDFIYMINLDQRPEKWRKSLEELASYGIVPWRFSAVNG